ncbi:MAG TPA: hypothetical protein VJ842_17230 [Pyrinomonadaceae bacterium]|nr:hypothetical protein [Pyrinomonadaceae bacterium]
MKVELIQPEPDLEFGDGGLCPDIRFGIGHYGTFDFANARGPRQIKIGFVGTDESVSALIEWLERCQHEIPGKLSKYPRLHPPFPSFATNHSFHSRLVWDKSEFRHLTIPDELKQGSFNEVVEKVVDLYVEEIDQVSERSGAHVVLCAPPIEHLKIVTHVPHPTEAAEQEEPPEKRETTWYEFHDLLKAKTLRLRTPLQHILPATYDESKAAALKKLKNRYQQDEATKTWNLFTAIYYKARGIPWRMTRDVADIKTCYLGVSFFRTLDKQRMYASSAQVFNQLGEGVIVRGGRAYEDTYRQIHLDHDGAYNLISLALEAFKTEHRHYPARVVLHKTSSFTKDEHAGFMKFLKEKGIDFADFVYLTDSFTRLFRPKTLPPLRGTLWHLDDHRAILYTKGSVPFYETYPGGYPPKTLYMDCEYAQRSVKEIARECLALSKMNWNNTRFDGQLPITLRAARQVGLILKYLEGVPQEHISPSYRFYM